MFVRNARYIGAWDHEVTREMKRRIFLDVTVFDGGLNRSTRLF